jgi:hypothetical protein
VRSPCTAQRLLSGMPTGCAVSPSGRCYARVAGVAQAPSTSGAGVATIIDDLAIASGPLGDWRQA